jgi:hypothetical protein
MVECWTRWRFNLIDLCDVDEKITDDMIKVFRLVANRWHSADQYGLGAEFEQLLALWRRPRNTASRRS